jgi:hypothetical protein
MADQVKPSTLWVASANSSLDAGDKRLGLVHGEGGAAVAIKRELTTTISTRVSRAGIRYWASGSSLAE